MLCHKIVSQRLLYTTRLTLINVSHLVTKITHVSLSHIPLPPLPPIRFGDHLFNRVINVDKISSTINSGILCIHKMFLLRLSVMKCSINAHSLIEFSQTQCLIKNNLELATWITSGEFLQRHVVSKQGQFYVVHQHCLANH